MVRLPWQILACVFLLLPGVGARAAPAADLEGQLTLGYRELKAAASGADGAAERALACFDAILATDPASARARAGRGLALIARAIEAPMSQKLRLAREGCAELDAAVAAAPEDAAVRLMRATNAVQMPFLLERHKLAETDFAILLSAARAPATTLEPALRRNIFYQAAAFALKDRRHGAVDLLEEAASISASDPTDEQIETLLALARRQPTSTSHADSHSPEEASASRP